MTFLLDTNVVSELAKPAPDAKCVAWLEKRRGHCVLSTITLSEIRYGIEWLPAGKRKAAMEQDYRFLTEDYAGLFFEFDGPAATEWGRYATELEANHGADWWKHFDLRDTQIAAIAREYGLMLATRNVKDFPYVATDNPFA